MYFFEDDFLEAKFDGTNWTDFKVDTVGKISGFYGIPGNGPYDRVGAPGWLKFDLLNTADNSAELAGYYTPGHVNCRTGFAAGLEVRICFTLDGLKVVKWQGWIPVDGIQPPQNVDEYFTSVTVKGWFYFASIHPMSGFPLAQDKDLMESIPLILANIDIQPPGTPNYRTGESTFSYVGDTIQKQTLALAEIGKLVQSELGYCFMTRFGLRVEGRMTRNDEMVNVNQYPVPKAECAKLKNEADDHIVNELGQRIILSNAKTAYFQDKDLDVKISAGKNYYNSVRFKCYPRRIDAAATTVLFNLDNPMQIKAGETITIRGSYRDPAGVAQSVCGIEMIGDTGQPPLVGGTHYSANAVKDGSGTNITSDITVTAVFGTGDFTYTIANGGVSDGYITLCKAVGKGVYTDQPVEYFVKDAAAIAKYGDYPLTVDMKCQDDPAVAQRYANITLFQHGQLKDRIDAVSYMGNLEQELLYAFLYLEPGSLIKLKKATRGIDTNYFIQGVEYSLLPGGLFEFTWYVREAGLDVFRYAKWTLDDTPVPGSGGWDDPVYGWDF